MTKSELRRQVKGLGLTCEFTRHASYVCIEVFSPEGFHFTNGLHGLVTDEAMLMPISEADLYLDALRDARECMPLVACGPDCE